MALRDCYKPELISVGRKDRSSKKVEYFMRTALKMVSSMKKMGHMMKKIVPCPYTQVVLPLLKSRKARATFWIKTELQEIEYYGIWMQLEGNQHISDNAPVNWVD